MLKEAVLQLPLRPLPLLPAVRKYKLQVRRGDAQAEGPTAGGSE